MGLQASDKQSNNNLFSEYLTSIRKTILLNSDGTSEVDQLLNISKASFEQYLGAMDRHTNMAGGAFSVLNGYTDSFNPNAFADKWNEHHVIGVDASLAVMIQEFTFFCFAQKDFFPELGNASVETSPTPMDGTPPGLWLFKKTWEGMTELPSDMKLFAPVDETRTAAAMFLTILMLRFVNFHELMHGIRGHVDYLKSIKSDNNLGLDELGLMDKHNTDVSIDAKILQCMEFEADSGALEHCLTIQVDGIENIEALAALPADLRYQLSLFSVYAMTWLLESIATTFKRTRLNITHPAPIRRLQMLQNIAVNELKHSELDYASITRDTLKQFESVLQNVDEDWKQTDKFDPVIYRETFDQLRKTLEPFRYLTPE